MYTVRHITNENEIQKLNLLRDTIYSSGRLANLSTPEHEVTRWSKHTYHLGLYKRLRLEERLIGCMKITPELEGECALPVHDYGVNSESLREFMRVSRVRSQRVCEAGGFAINPEFQVRGVSRMFIEAAAAFSMLHLGYDSVVLVTFPFLLRLYRNVGFRIIPGASPEDSPQYGMKGIVAHTCLEHVSCDVTQRLRAHHENFNSYGATTLNCDSVAYSLPQHIGSSTNVYRQ